MLTVSCICSSDFVFLTVENSECNISNFTDFTKWVMALKIFTELSCGYPIVGAYM